MTSSTQEAGPERQAATSACIQETASVEAALCPALGPGPGAEPGHPQAPGGDFQQSGAVLECLEADAAQNFTVKNEQ